MTRAIDTVMEKGRCHMFTLAGLTVVLITLLVREKFWMLDLQTNKSTIKFWTTGDLQTNKTQLSVCKPESRLAVQREVCTSWNHTVNNIQMSSTSARLEFPTGYYTMVDDAHKLIICAPPKCGSSTWHYIQMKAGGAQSKGGIHDNKYLEKYGVRRLTSYTPEETQSCLASYYKVLVTRHPYDRLVSAWQDKMVVSNSRMRPLAINITRTYRTSSSSAGSQDDVPSFPEFVQYLVDNNFPANDHWMTSYDLCSACVINWDLIIKTETLALDSAAVLDRLGLPKESTLPVVHSRRGESGSSLPKYSRGLSREFRDVRAADLERIAEFYSRDMMMYGYGWDANSFVASCGDRDHCC